MRLDPKWKILTIGDGDLSFSLSLFQDLGVKNVVATVLDDANTIQKKYSDNALNTLSKLNIPTITNFDVTDPQSWQGFEKNRFDLVIFQFPLIPHNDDIHSYQLANKIGSSNLQNRRLLRLFLRHAFEYFLAPQGQQLAMITSKNVKPYSDWNIEHSLHQGIGIRYLGELPFEQNQFPSYRIRNVNRDKQVKHTAATTYVWGRAPNPLLKDTLQPSAKNMANHCPLCGTGPIKDKQDRLAHESSKRHVQLQVFEEQWLSYLDNNPYD